MTEKAISALGNLARNKLSRFKEYITYYWSDGDPLFDEESEVYR